MTATSELTEKVVGQLFPRHRGSGMYFRFAELATTDNRHLDDVTPRYLDYLDELAERTIRRNRDGLAALCRTL